MLSTPVDACHGKCDKLVCMPIHSMHTKDASLRIKLANGKVEIHDLAVLKVVSRDARGRPKDVQFVHGEEQIDVSDGMNFLVVWAPRKVMEPTLGRSGD